jgi:hypothetical protein
VLLLLKSPLISHESEFVGLQRLNKNHTGLKAQNAAQNGSKKALCEARFFRFYFETALASCNSKDLLFAHVMTHKFEHSTQERARQHLQHVA